MTNVTDDNTTESVCSWLGSDAVASNMKTNWQSWGKIDFENISKREDISETSVYETLERAGAGFTPLSGEVWFKHPVTGQMIQDNDHKAVFNPNHDSALAIVGHGFNLISYWDVLQGITGEIIENGFIPARIICFDRGARVLMQCVIPERYYAAGRDHNSWLTISTGINGQVKTRGGNTLWTPICSNTLTAAIHDLNQFSAKRTKNMSQKLSSIKSNLFSLKSAGEKTLETWDQWADYRVTKSLEDQFVHALIPMTDSKAGMNRQNELRESIHVTSQEIVQDGMSIYDLMAGTTRYVSHRKQNRSGGEQYQYVTEGVGAAMIDRARSWLTDYVESHP